MPTSFVITGFGPFGGVEANPTTVIVRKLDAYLRARDESSGNGPKLADLVKEYIILETSAQAVNETLARIQNEQSCVANDTNETAIAKDQQKIIFLHLGVGRALYFRLEHCAYNEATFRIPDQKGHRPTRQAIVESDPVGLCYKTSLNLKSLQEQMEKDFPKRTLISEDPGRFVCNYVYCKSLEVASALNSKHAKSTLETNSSGHQSNNICYESLFLHVPHFSHISEEEQLAYVAALIQNLAAGQGA